MWQEPRAQRQHPVLPRGLNGSIANLEQTLEFSHFELSIVFLMVNLENLQYSFTKKTAEFCQYLP